MKDIYSISGELFTSVNKIHERNKWFSFSAKWIQKPTSEYENEDKDEVNDNDM